MGSPAGTSVLERIVDLEDERFIASHAREPVPAVLRVVFYGVGLADAVRIPALGYDEVIGAEAARIADRQRKRLDREPYRTPHLNDGEAAAQKLVGFLRQQIPHALRTGPLGIVVVHTANDLTNPACLAQLVVGRA